MTASTPIALTRRRLLCAGAASLASASAVAQPGRAGGRPLAVAQIVDISQSEQDVAKDFLIGARAAWQDINARGGVRGRPVQHVVLETDGSAASVRAAVHAARDQGCIALSGTVSDPVATQVTRLLQQENIAMAHVAPWLQNSSVEVDDRTFPIFAARQEQITHAMKSLQTMGVSELGAIYASQRERDLYQDDVNGIAAALRLKLASSQPGRGEDLVRLGQRLGASAPALLLFLGGTPELVAFSQGLDRQSRQRYLVALADVNLQTVQQMGGGKGTPIIATQAVPMVTSSGPIVRRYREVMARLFDEPPVALSLAGFIAARYTYEVLADADVANRGAVIQAFQRRGEVDLGGYRIHFDARRRSATYVTQSMLTADGRVVG